MDLDNLKEEEINIGKTLQKEFIAKYEKINPDITSNDFEYLINSGLMAGMQPHNLRAWARRSIQSITPERMQRIKEDPYFMLRERCWEEYPGYIPVCMWSQAEQEFKSYEREFGKQVATDLFKASLKISA